MANTVKSVLSADMFSGVKMVKHVFAAGTPLGERTMRFKPLSWTKGQGGKGEAREGGKERAWEKIREGRQGKEGTEDGRKRGEWSGGGGRGCDPSFSSSPVSYISNTLRIACTAC